jgi:hypothetical protein
MDGNKSNLTLTTSIGLEFSQDTINKEIDIDK